MLLNNDGELLTVESTLELAVEKGFEHADEVYVDNPEHASALLEKEDLSLAANVSQLVSLDRIQTAPEESFKMTGLPRLSWDEVMSLSPEKAHWKLEPYFPTQRVRKDGKIEPIYVYKQLRGDGIIKALLGQNYKTSKQIPGEDPSDVQALSLLPYWLVFEGRKALEAQISEKFSRSFSLDKDYGVRAFASASKERSLCFGSTDQCRSACLVYTGQNVQDVYTQVSKFCRTQALLAEPIAFCRILIESIAKHLLYTKEQGTVPYFRLNTYSDIPWELFFPDLFEVVQRLDQRQQSLFYDYTKVPNRRRHKNYDLTFSFAGTRKNMRGVEHELNVIGRRIAVVFFHESYKKWRRIKDKFSVKMMGLPNVFMKYKVIDGDISDLRPLDPDQCIVGLRWKIPLGRDIDPQKLRYFVVRVVEIDRQWVAAEVPRQTFGDRVTIHE